MTSWSSAPTAIAKKCQIKEENLDYGESQSVEKSKNNSQIIDG